MINIQPHIDKLDLLREYMFLKIDRSGFKSILDLYIYPTAIPKTFEQYINTKQQSL